MRLPLRAALALAATAALGACAQPSDPAAPPCPEVSILADAAKLERFRPGGGRDVSDLVVQAEIVGYRGACVYRPGHVELTLALAFEAELGPAATARETEFEYFVAIPEFYPAPTAKAVFQTRPVFAENVKRKRHIDDAVVLTIPLEEGTSAASLDVLVGFQLAPEELRHNRTDGR